jgi:zinc transporter, ZIP family
VSHASAAALGAIAGATIFIGLPVGRIRGITKQIQGALNALATGVLVFLLWDILSHASSPVEVALAGLRRGDRSFLGLAVIFAGGLALGLLSLIYVNGRLFGRTKQAPPAPPRTLAMMIATGLGLHNLSEGLAIGQSAATGAVAFAVVLMIGFALHNVTEGFGIAAPLAMDTTMPSWGFLASAGIIGGGPTFLGTVIGYAFTSTYIYVLFLALAAGALLYVINEMFHLGRRLNTPVAMGWGLLAGFLLSYATDLFLTYVGA